MQERILQCAQQEIETRGIRFTMADLARRAGISTKTLYASFPSKEVLIARLIADSIEELKASEDRILHDPHLDLTEKMRELLALVPSGFARTDLRVWYELKRYYPAQWKMVEEVYQEEWEHVRVLLEQGVEAGVFRPVQLPILILMYTGALDQLIDQQLSGRHQMTIGEALDAMIDILLGGVLAAPATRGETGK
ncbi:MULTISPECIES: TetR/AcrR family transcriptional regulator [Brevibacillus]|uniref:TetR/AcrR family transcriptional regulator n=1 Tax=Brevibacillus TaxID=55080 RepID=UPI000271A20C|nr:MULTISPECIES: TetR/AcrR family transcriptional regulator [Brevibacillus]EJL43405.1 transcriptional regulator [Brevibacillus sp. CF112]MDN4092795.1 TetR/AcrR family transcriptional regulator [Brevibacillus agri]MED1824642.1 TetR/AcrR family transcriptional regulator [Brevibacillus agri]MED4568728.1 TetR/AcrR family transcriptional regulator [Brevibacillus agri]WHX30039.1 TetR/AcrR family transcriptional regulator [Brevibacillus agri]